MASRNLARSATLDPLLPELAEGLLRQRREVARVRPPAHRTGDRSDGAVSQEWLLGNATRFAGDVVQCRTLHHILEALESYLLEFARQSSLYLTVAKLQKEIMQRNADGARLRAGAAERRGVRQVLRLFVALKQGRYDGADRTGVGRPVGVTAGLAIYGTDVQAGPTADAVEGLFELGAQKIRAAVVQQDQVHLLCPVELALVPRPGYEI